LKNKFIDAGLINKKLNEKAINNDETNSDNAFEYIKVFGLT